MKEHWRRNLRRWAFQVLFIEALVVAAAVLAMGAYNPDSVNKFKGCCNGTDPAGGYSQTPSGSTQTINCCYAREGDPYTEDCARCSDINNDGAIQPEECWCNAHDLQNNTWQGEPCDPNGKPKLVAACAIAD